LPENFRFIFKMSWTTYKEKVKSLSVKMIQAQKPIRILNSIRTNAEWDQTLLKSNFKELPRGEREFYEKVELGFDAQAKYLEFKLLKAEIEKVLGIADELGGYMQNICDQYMLVVEMLKNRGRAEFHTYSCQLYGSPKDCFLEDLNTISEMAHMLYGILAGIETTLPQTVYPENIDAKTLVAELNTRFATYFGEKIVLAKVSDGIVADAAAGGDKVKIREGAMFSVRDLDIYEVHEGWVHVGTTLNGRNQPVCEFLSIGPPRCASTQEGLAVIMEIFTFRTYIRRAKEINDRIISIEKAQDGADLLQIIEYLRTEGYTERECITNAMRVFRGGTLSGGAPFTKDISYCRGFVENYNFLRSAIRAGKPHLIPYLFAGKLHVEDIPLIYKKHMEGIVEAPKFVPPHFRDLNGIAVWMSFSSFFNRVDLKSVQEHYTQLFARYL
jgi:uncharacterized protein (TIGR02421 family)